MDPPVSVPRAAKAEPAATEALDPPEEPPGVRFVGSFRRFKGLILGPNTLVRVEDPIANSSRLVFPREIAPASFSFWVTVDSYGGTKFSKIREAQVVRIFLVQKMSLMASGRPSSARAVPWT